MNRGWHGPEYRSERRGSLNGGNSVGHVKPPAPSKEQDHEHPALSSDDDDDELGPGAYAVTRDGSASDVFLEDLEDPNELPSSMPPLDTIYNMYDEPAADNDDTKDEKPFFTRRKECILAAFLLCCIVSGIVLAAMLSRGRHETKSVLVPEDTTCLTSPSDPFSHCNLCGQRIIVELDESLRTVYDSLVKSPELRNHLDEAGDIDIHSCSPVNKALIWIALELEEAIFPVERVINRFALALFYASMGGKDWKNQDKWLSSAHECDWHGVGCNRRHNSIISIDLHSNDLDGTLENTRLGLLTNLRSIDLTNNDIKGSIPSSIFRFPALETFLVGRNLLQGTVPSIPEANETVLQRLVLSKNDLTGAIPNLSGLVNLTELRLGRTQMTGAFPSECLGKLSQLQFLDLEDLKDGQHPDLLPSLTSMTNLKELHLERARLHGTIPESIGNMTSLESLWMTSAELSGTIPTTLGLLTNLKFLRLDVNYLEGTIPFELGELTQMETLFLSRMDRLEGTLPFDLATKCAQLMYFSVSFTQVTGTVPESFGKLAELQEMNIECSGLQLPPIPDDLCINHSGYIVTNIQNQEALANCSCCKTSKEVISEKCEK